MSCHTCAICSGAGIVLGMGTCLPPKRVRVLLLGRMYSSRMLRMVDRTEPSNLIGFPMHPRWSWPENPTRPTNVDTLKIAGPAVTAALLWERCMNKKGKHPSSVDRAWSAVRVRSGSQAARRIPGSASPQSWRPVCCAAVHGALPRSRSLLRMERPPGSQNRKGARQDARQE